MSSILETFFILFQTDAKRVQGEVEGAEASAVKLAETLDKVGDIDPTGVRDVSKALDDAGEGARDMARQLDKAPPEAARLKRELIDADRAAAKLGGSFVGLATKLGAMVGGALSVGAVIGGIRDRFNEIIELGERANRFNFNIEGFVAFGGIVEEMGGNAEDAERYVRRFSDAIRMAYGDVESEPGKALASLKVSAADAAGGLRDTEAVVLDLATALEGVSKQTAIDRLRRLGIVDPAMIELLLQGRANLEKMMAAEKAKNLVTEEGAKKARALKMAMDDVKDVFDAWFTSMVSGLSGPLTAFADWLIAAGGWAARNGALVQGFMVGLGAALAITAAVLWGSYIPAWTAAAVATLAATWPILAITAAVLAAAAAFALAWEDVQFFLKGQPSLLGDLVAKYEGVRKAVDFIRAALGYLSDGAGAAWGALTDAAGEFFGFLERSGPGVADTFRAIYRVASAVFSGIWRVAGPILSLIVDAFRLAGDVNATVFRFIWQTWSETFGRLWPYAKPIVDLVMAGVRLIGDVFAEVAQAVWGQWGPMFDRFVERIQAVIGWARQLMGFVETARQALERVTPGGRPPPATAGAVARGRGQVEGASRAPLAAQTPTSVGARQGGNRSTNVKVEKVEVHTKATDAKGMAKAAGGALTSELRRTTANYDDGIDR